MKITAGEELIDAMAELRVLFPDWRMGQLVANLVTAAGGMDAGAIWDMEDDQLLAAARRLLDRNRGRTAAQAEGTTTRWNPDIDAHLLYLIVPSAYIAAFIPLAFSIFRSRNITA